ncbi:hypothetical protein J3458_020958 [Metarhizium acridum]|uniref:uncharacterized protein n=1 Tax=Metarhizium acridum TaxID=92637 RepID=UPI001C6C4F30|nr:hypothetical protein J3458_020958 [Metarhizium acridum]
MCMASTCALAYRTDAGSSTALAKQKFVLNRVLVFIRLCTYVDVVVRSSLCSVSVSCLWWTVKKSITLSTHPVQPQANMPANAAGPVTVALSSLLGSNYCLSVNNGTYNADQYIKTQHHAR